MTALAKMFFPARLAARQLGHEHAKTLAAVMGVWFACILVFMQLGFKDALYASAASAPIKLTGDLFLIATQTEAMWRTQTFPRSELKRTLAHPAVARIEPVYMGLAHFKNPDTRLKNTLMVYGYTPDSQVFKLPEIDALATDLRLPDSAAFDLSSRPEFGVSQAIPPGPPIATEINDRNTRIIGTFRLGISFAADGNVLTSTENFHRFFPLRRTDAIDLGVMYLKPAADLGATQRDLRQLLNPFVKVLSYQELVDNEKDYWRKRAPIGFIFGFGTIMGLVVGMVIVYQILFTDISGHLSEYATLLAMGYRHGYLVRVVFATSVFLAVLGFIPGLLSSLALYHLAETKIFMPMPMTMEKALTVFALTLLMCIASGLLAMTKLRAVDPADMF
ncbi:MAG: ABC transporter permease DevC [Methylococcales bacterium]|nr:ABC transporter permease DevC [Methylococcales bacterium]